MAVGRLHGWEERLAAFILEWQGKKFVRGQYDCALFVAGALEMMTGVDPAAPYRGNYSTKEEAIAELRKRYGSIEETAQAYADENGLEEVKAVYAQRGALVYGEEDAGGYLGIVDMGARSVLTFTEHGLRSMPKENFLRFWNF